MRLIGHTPNSILRVLMHLMALGTFWLIAAGQLVYTTLKPS